MNDYFVNGLRLPYDLYAMIDKECKRRDPFHGSWSVVYPVIIDALYAHFNSLEASYNKEDSKK